MGWRRLGCLSAGVARELGGLLGSLRAGLELVGSSQPARGDEQLRRDACPLGCS